MPFFVPSTVISSQVSAAYLQNSALIANASAYTFATQNVGAVANDRVIIVGVTSAMISGGVPTSVVVGGVSATLLKSVAGSASSLWAVPLPAGTTANVVVTLPSAAVRCAVTLWRVTGMTGLSAYGSASDITGGGAMKLPVPSGGYVIGVAYNFGSAAQTFTWTGITKQFDASSGSAPNIDTWSGAQGLSASDQLLTVTATPSGAAAANGSCVVSIG